MFNFEDILRGYSSEQYTEAMIYIVANFLKEKGLIDMKEFQEYHKNNLAEALKQIIERDKEIAKEKIEALKGGSNK